VPELSRPCGDRHGTVAEHARECPIRYRIPNRTSPASGPETGPPAEAIRARTRTTVPRPSPKRRRTRTRMSDPLPHTKSDIAASERQQLRASPGGSATVGSVPGTDPTASGSVIRHVPVVDGVFSDRCRRVRRFGACDRWLLRRSCTPPRPPRVRGTSAPTRSWRRPNERPCRIADSRRAWVQPGRRVAPVGGRQEPPARRRQVDASNDR
jgi:hypothetical protein